MQKPTIPADKGFMLQDEVSLDHILNTLFGPYTVIDTTSAYTA